LLNTPLAMTKRQKSTRLTRLARANRLSRREMRSNARENHAENTAAPAFSREKADPEITMAL